jgi:hypothetical protein
MLYCKLLFWRNNARKVYLGFLASLGAGWYSDHPNQRQE